MDCSTVDAQLYYVLFLVKSREVMVMSKKWRVPCCSCVSGVEERPAGSTEVLDFLRLASGISASGISASGISGK